MIYNTVPPTGKAKGLVGASAHTINDMNKAAYDASYDISFAQLDNTFGGVWGSKHVACGQILDVSPRVLTITATTVPGVCGGPVVPLHQPTTFGGICM